MNIQFTLSLDDEKATLEETGGKGASLARLARAGLLVPSGYHVITNAYRNFVNENNLLPEILGALEETDADDPNSLEKASQVIKAMFVKSPIPDCIAQAILAAYNNLPGVLPVVAVRSSATAEDLPEASFAGQQETFLNISGAEEVLDATRKCWASLWTARAIDYRARHGISPEDVSIAVVVQKMVPAEAAGILFTVNPINGNRNQMLISASWGLGEAIVGGLVSPDNLTIDKISGKVIERQTGKKTVQTVPLNGGTREQPVPEHLQEAPVLNNTQAKELAELGVQIEAIYGMPMDIEWAYADGQFVILQARPVTALPEPEPPAPIEWKLPKGAYAAMRNNIVELMTDPLTPLFKTFGLHAVNTSMKRLMDGFLGDIGLLPGEMIIAVNEYAYYNGSVKFGPMLKVMLDAGGIMKRMFTGAVERWTEEGLPRYIEIVKTWEAAQWQELSSAELVTAARQLAEAAVDAYGALVGGVIPAAWMSEAWFTFRYKFVKRKSDPEAPVFLMGFDSLPIKAEKALHDLAGWVKERVSLKAYLARTAASDLITHLDSDLAPPSVDVDQWQDWRSHFGEYLEKFGHTIYNLDFGNPIPADDPAPILETLKLYLSDGGTNPHERQAASAERREAATRAIEERLKGRRLRVFQKNLARAQKYAPLREDGLADVGLSYPLLRQILRHLGQRFVDAGAIGKADNIFWLIEREVNESAARLDNNQKLVDLSERISKRKAKLKAVRKVSPPLMLPQIKVFGVDLAELKSGARKRNSESIKGVAASPGSVRAPACVIHGPQDFAKMSTGDVLVASLTTPAWTPLFVRASAVVTDIGGPLSHGSIVAREYGIPAVLGTGVATSRIQDGQLITVDGDSGMVILENGNR